MLMVQFGCLHGVVGVGGEALAVGELGGRSRVDKKYLCYFDDSNP